MSDTERKIVEFFEKRYLFFAFIIITLFALGARYSLIGFKSHDYYTFLEPWLNHFRNNGGILGLANYPGDYNAPYMTIMALFSYIDVDGVYLIQGLSIVFDFGLALSAAFLVKHLVPRNKKLYFLIAYTIILFMPDVIMNSSLWSQCDSGYTLFVVLALLFLCKEKYFASFIFLGIAFALKLQFIFILPVFIIVYVVKKEFPIIYFLIPIAVNIILCLPAIIVGKPIMEVLSVYINQVSGAYALSLNILNIYELVGDSAMILIKYGVFVVLAICLLMLCYIVHKKISLNSQKILNLALWFSVITTFLLPYMHDRYLYMSGILALIYYLVYKKNLLLLISITLASIITYFAYLFSGYFDARHIFVIAYAGVLAYYTRDVLFMLREDNK